MSLPLFADSCSRAHAFPDNLVDAGPFYPSLLHEYRQRLTRRAPSLFCSSSSAEVELFCYDEAQTSFKSVCLTSLQELQRHLPCSMGQVQRDHPSSFVFIGAPSSRDALDISHEMALWVFSFFQVLPTFLEFLFAFGEQLYAVDFQFSGFREDTRLETAFQRDSIPELGRSGQDYQICYNLKTFEPKQGLDWPWSSRQTVVFHTFDVQSGNASWIAIKANNIIRDRLKEVSNTRLAKDSNTYRNVPKKFANTLACHLVVVEWSGENWRGYLNFIEEQLHTLKRRAMVDKVTPFVPHTTSARTASPDNQSNGLHPKRTWTVQTVRRNTATAPAAPITAPQQTHPLLPVGIAVNVADEPKDPPNLPPEYDPKYRVSAMEEDQKGYRIEELQAAQALESTVNDAGLVLKSNISVLSQVEGFFERLPDSPDIDVSLRSSMRASIPHFLKRTRSVRSDLQMHLNRIEAVSKLIAECKNLLYGIVEYQSMQANKIFAEEARLSAQRMEEMTEKMQDLTLKTTIETVLMRIITVVTVFFLPATFVSTLMSTDIVHFTATDSRITSGSTSLGAVKLFLCLSFSLMFATFASGFGLYWGAVRYGG